MREDVWAFLERVEERKQEIDAYVTMLGNTMGPARVNGEELDPLIGWCLTCPVNFTGHPAAPVPAGFTRDGPPDGMELIGHRFDEATVPVASAAFERTGPRYGSYPPRSEQASGTGPQRNGKRRQHA